MREKVLGREWPYPLFGQLVGIWKSHDEAQAKSLDDRVSVGYLLVIDIWQSGTTRIMQDGVVIKGLGTTTSRIYLETNLASRWEGVRLPRASGKSPDFPGSSPNFPGSFSATSPGSSLTVELNSNPEVPRKFPKLPRKFPKTSPEVPGLPRRSASFSGKPDTLSRLTKTFSDLDPCRYHLNPSSDLDELEKGMPWRSIQDEFGKFKWIDHAGRIYHGTPFSVEPDITSKHIFIASMMHTSSRTPVMNDAIPDVTCPADFPDSEKRKEVVHHEQIPDYDVSKNKKQHANDKKSNVVIKAKSIPVTLKAVASSSGCNARKMASIHIQGN